MHSTLQQIQTIAFPHQKNVRHFVLFGLAVLAVSVSLYVYFLGKVVFDVVARGQAERRVAAAQSAISSLQVAYFNQVKGFDIAQAESAGFYESRDTLYASRATVATKTVGMLR
jgi:hypothetical protein